MKLKKVKMLCMITAISASAMTGGFEAGGMVYGNVNVNVKFDSETPVVGFEEKAVAAGVHAKAIEQTVISELVLPRVGSGEEYSEESENMIQTDEIETEPEMEAVEGAELQEHTEETVEEIPEESNLIIADVSNYVNIRSLPSEEGEILGKLYDDSVGIRHGEENGWYYITSGKVTGYVKADYVLTGEAAEQKAREVGTRLAEVTTTTLKVRKEATTDSIVLGLVPGGDILAVLEETEGWVKVSVEEGEGYVSADYVRVYTENVEAESKEEEEARLKKEEEERKKAEEAARKAIASQNAAASASNSNKQNSSTSSGGSSGNKNTGSSSNSAGNSNTNSGSSGSTNSSGSSSGQGTSNSADLGRQIADYALQFVGNPYVYGGTSLTNGADCSGFVMSVYANFGISLPRTSGEQGASGSAVSGLSNAKPGDLIWYSGHIGIYIGDSKVVHASNEKNGIMVSKADYRTILGIRRIV